MIETEETTTDVLNEILNAGAGPIDRTIYMACMYSHFEDWPNDIDVLLPGIFKMASDGDRIGTFEGRA